MSAEKQRAVQNSVQALQGRVELLVKGDIGRGRAAQATLREWANELAVARRLRRPTESCEDQVALAGWIEKMQAAMIFLREYSKHAPAIGELVRTFVPAFRTFRVSCLLHGPARHAKFLAKPVPGTDLCALPWAFRIVRFRCEQACGIPRCGPTRLAWMPASSSTWA